MSSITVPVRDYTEGHRAFARESARQFRAQVDEAIEKQGNITFDLSDVRAISAGFADEMIGRLVVWHGPDILSRILFLRCQESVRSVLSYVANDRLQHYHANTSDLSPIH